MSTIVHCDLCGKPMTDFSRTFKVKELKGSWYDFSWTTIDVHDACIKKLMDAVEERKETANETGFQN